MSPVSDRVAIEGWTAELVPAAPAPAQARVLGSRGRAILARRGILAGCPELLSARLPAAGVARDCRPGLQLLLSSIAGRDAALAERAAHALLGLGPGLTPEGDDLLSGAGATVWACARAAGWSDAERAAWLDAVAGGDLRERTTELSAALLQSTLAGRPLWPLRTVLDLREGAAASWSDALAQLARIGSTTGPAYAVAVGAAAYLSPTIATSNPETTRHGTANPGTPKRGDKCA